MQDTYTWRTRWLDEDCNIACTIYGVARQNELCTLSIYSIETKYCQGYDTHRPRYLQKYPKKIWSIQDYLE